MSFWGRLISGRGRSLASALPRLAKGLGKRFLSPAIWVLGVGMLVLALTLAQGHSGGPAPDPEVLPDLNSQDDLQSEPPEVSEDEEGTPASSAPGASEQDGGGQQTTNGILGGEPAPTVDNASAPLAVDTELASTAVSTTEEDTSDSGAPGASEEEVALRNAEPVNAEPVIASEDDQDSVLRELPSLDTPLVPVERSAPEEVMTKEGDEPEPGIGLLVDGNSSSEEAAVEEAVRDHYLAIGVGDFERAYSDFGRTFRGTKDQQSWVEDEESNKITASTINCLGVDKVAGSVATASVDVSFKDSTGNPRFVIIWNLVKQGDRWKLDHQLAATKVN